MHVQASTSLRLFADRVEHSFWHCHLPTHLPLLYVWQNALLGSHYWEPQRFLRRDARLPHSLLRRLAFSGRHVYWWALH